MINYNMNRDFMKSLLGNNDIIATADIAKGIPQPEFQKSVNENSITVDLPIITSDKVPKADFFEIISSRISRRSYSKTPMNLEELSFLLWCTQGVKKVIGGYRRYIKDGSGRNYLRPVAAGGCINAYETYIAINNVQGLEKGIWRYLPLSNQIILEKQIIRISEKTSEVFTNKSQDQIFTSKAAAIFFWACTPYRGEWRYKETSHKIMLIDLGHISHQLYLATETIGCGCCTIGGYYQDKADALIGVDGENEYTVLCASVGHVTDKEKNWIERFPDARIDPDFYK
ncbi:thioester oxidase [Vallitalea longa]|uniref:Thioester oxidase n=1 Tax=Vallitalea longa TaxID=2936439 RepID=A0A9W5YAZ1_9FIRM|nr:SagB/ThcOx family dehydrogenase [Vallitalea longa]GKX29171.1 thioester oxidase [Vallitalea longa]